jgi:glycosyltransferase involved in cell wall biosynthesis
MSAYNDLRFLDIAVESALRQDFTDFEFIIVDDGTGETAVFEALRQRDPRIRIIVSPRNLGGASAGNLGIGHARSDIIVRLDADDVCMPTRVGKLVAALEQDPGLGLVGSAVEFINEAGDVFGGQEMPQTDLEIRWTILFHNPFFHPAVAFRRSIFERAGRYRPEEAVSYDHYMWFDMLPFCRARNLPDHLAQYRWNPRGLTGTHRAKPRNRTHRIREALWKDLGLAYDLYDDDLADHISAFVRGETIAAPEQRLPAYEAILKVTRAFVKSAPGKNGNDKAATQRLAGRIVERMLQDPPLAGKDRSKLYRLCFTLAPLLTARRWIKAEWGASTDAGGG